MLESCCFVGVGEDFCEWVCCGCLIVCGGFFLCRCFSMCWVFFVYCRLFGLFLMFLMVISNCVLFCFRCCCRVLILVIL